MFKYPSSINNGDHIKSVSAICAVFFPEEPLSNDPIYVVYHCCGAGHYDYR